MSFALIYQGVRLNSLLATGLGAGDYEVLVRAGESDARKLSLVSAARGSYFQSLRFTVALRGACSCFSNNLAAFHYQQLASLVVNLNIIDTFAYQSAVDLDVRQKIYGLLFAFRENRDTRQ